MKKQLLLLLLLFTSSFIFSQTLGQPNQFNNVCDDNNDGFAQFYLGEITFEITLNNPNLVVTHHLTQGDAASGINPLPMSYTNVTNPQLIFARVVNTLSGQIQIITYNLSVHSTPSAPTETLTVCVNNGATNCWDLTQLIPGIVNGSAGLDVSFFQTQTDAVMNTNAILNPTCYVSFVTTPTVPPLYYRVEDATTGCYAVGTIQLLPVACVTCADPMALMLMQVAETSALLSWTSPATSAGTEYFIGPPTIQPSFDTPASGTVPTGLNSLSLSGLACNTNYNVYLRNICSPTQTSAWVGPINFFTTNCSNVPGQPVNLTACTDSPTNCFDLSVNTANVLGTLNPSEYTVSYYASQADAANATNALSSSYCPPTSPYTIFVRLQQIGGNYQIMTFTLTSNTSQLAATNLMAMSQCDDNSNGVIIYNLTDIQAQINTTNVLEYYLTAADAQNGTNPIANPTAFSVNVLPASVAIFVREIVIGGCDLIHSFLLQNSPNCNAAANCLAANSLCSSLGVPFSNTTNVPQSGAAGCLGTTPNPTWFYIPVSTAGNINLLITQIANNSGNAIDVDFIVYGPFNSPTTPCSNTSLLSSNIAACSYSTAAVETAVITNAQPGQYYLLMVTNFANQPGMITISQTNAGQTGSGSIACTGLRLNAFLDTNTNGVKDNGEQNFPLGQFHYEKNDNGILHHIIAPTGIYDIYDTSSSNSYDVSYTVDAGYAASYNVSPASYSNLTAGAGMTSYYFPVTVVQPYNDLAVTVVPLTAPRPGFTYMEKITYTNFGNQSVASGTLTFTKDGNVTITGNSQSGTVPTATGFTFSFTNLAPFETRTMTVTMQVPGIPTVSAGQLLTNVASIAPLAGDTIPENNTSSCAQVIINAYDPNDKMEAHGGRILFSTFTPNDYLYYTIRFENTGTASAINVRVNDVLDTKLDETSLKMVSASHAYNLDRVGNTLNWRFDNIQLPVSVANTTIGKGYITFKIKPKPGYAVGDIINNAASIYFDFNPAIVTNIFSTEFVAALGLDQFANNDFAIYPNPTSGLITVSLADNQDTLASIVVYDVLGKTIRSVKANTTTETIDLSELHSGVYFIEVTTGTNLKMVKKLMVK